MANPVLQSESFTKEVGREGVFGQTMTVRGAISKSFLLGFICFFMAWAAWGSPYAGVLAPAGGIGGFLIACVLCFKPKWSAMLAPIYAVLKGLMLGAISSYFEAKYQGIVIQAVGTTAGVFFAMLGAYQMGLIRPTRQFMAIVIGATLGIAVIYLASFVASFFGSSFSFISGNGEFAILFSGVVCVVAALNLIIDFGMIEEGAEVGAPKYMEWYCAFGLLVTLVWLYLEILRLLSKLRSR